MVFLVRETLTEEDKAACLKAAKRWCKSFYKPVKGQWSRKIVCIWLTAIGGFEVALISRDYGLWNLMNVWTLICLAGIWRIIWPWPPRAPVFFKPLPAPEFQGTPLRILFLGYSSFSVWTPTEKIRLNYSSITSAWEDEKRFYLFFQDRLPLVLRKSGFTSWMPEDFRDFLERELGAPVERVR